LTTKFEYGDEVYVSIPTEKHYSETGVLQVTEDTPGFLLGQNPDRPTFDDADTFRIRRVGKDNQYQLSRIDKLMPKYDAWHSGEALVLAEKGPGARAQGRNPDGSRKKRKKRPVEVPAVSDSSEDSDWDSDPDIEYDLNEVEPRSSQYEPAAKKSSGGSKSSSKSSDLPAQAGRVPAVSDGYAYQQRSIAGPVEVRWTRGSLDPWTSRTRESLDPSTSAGPVHRWVRSIAEPVEVGYTTDEYD